MTTPCTAKDLESLWPEGGDTFAEKESNGFAMLVRNVGAAPCTLAGYPKAQGLDRDGKPIGEVAIPAEQGKDVHVTIEPAEPAKVVLRTRSQGCSGPEVTYHGAELLLDNGFHVVARNAWLRGSCPLRVSGWEPVVNVAEPLWPLEARLQAPSWAEVGTELTYVLELVNVTRSTARLDPCPVFTQILTPEEGFDERKLDELQVSVRGTYQLNCAVNVIGPRAKGRYQMKVFIPEGFPEGRTVLYWMVEGGSRVSSTTVLNVSKRDG
ncbi:DUF4232 domain-containing protein [Allorhizocola rhizosphaerae]|uniref:DUF4232 domain-containing protein n=1 Tax=Allorhizocola rhizosphaerae TaxID=1872709 RepID=UPI0013C36BA9|nr:DUF4232 domain-containing protein [Allorhizocola rhizosphaerae]